MFVREADHAYNLGPAANRPYLDYAVLEQALRETGADAAWVGWGFVAEDPSFAEVCARIGVTFIGPSPEAMRKLGDKIGSKLIAEEVGVPVAPWSGGGVDTLEDAKAAAARIGYPLMLKATAGGGGRGIRMVASDADLTDAYERTRDEAQRAFGSGVVFLERLVTGARHVEVQVIADGQGTAWAIGVRDCSVQRRNQKVIEESASPVLAPEQVAEVKASAERLAVAVGYAGAGTVEFLYHPGEKFFAFLEVNTRLQVEHPITEVTTDTDLVKLQIHVAGGGRLEGERPAEEGHAVEARLNAEDPDRDFAPSPGRIALLNLPAGPGIRVDTGVGEGDSIPADFDSMIAKIIAVGRDPRRGAGPAAPRDGRDHRRHRGRRDQQELHPRPARPARGHRRQRRHRLDRPGPRRGPPGLAPALRRRARRRRHRGLRGRGGASSAPACSRPRAAGAPRCSTAPAAPSTSSCAARHTRSRCGGSGRTGSAWRSPPGPTEQTVDADLDRLDEYTSRLTIAGRTHRLITATHGPIQLVEVDGVTHRVSRDEGGVLRSPAPALVVATPVAVGAEVAAGAPVLVLESMKMETVLPAPFAGRVKELLVSAGSQVETGTPLVRLEPVGDGDEAAEAADRRAGRPRPARAAPAGDGAAATADQRPRRLRRHAARLRRRPARRGRHPRDLPAARDELTAQGSSQIRAEVDVLEVFADFAELSRNRPAGEEAHVEHRVHSPREHFHTYLQSLDVERGALPEQFRSKLGQRAAPLRPRQPRPHRRARGGGVPGLPRPAALGPRRRPGHLAAAALDGRALPRAAARRAPPARCSTGSSSPPSCASRSSATSPAACASAGSTSPWSTPTAPASSAG